MPCENFSKIGTQRRHLALGALFGALRALIGGRVIYLEIYFKYSYEILIMVRSHIMNQNAYFQEGIS